MRDAVSKCTLEFLEDIKATCELWRVLDKLQTIQGVGVKVANCVALFGLQRYDAFPVDVWIERYIEHECGGYLDTSEYEDVRGVVQQYIFYYMLVRK